MCDLSVIITVYNIKETYLRMCLDSVINQTLHNIEIIIIDDGSTNNCAAICDEYSSLDQRIRVFHVENGGQSRARNMAVDLAKSPLVMFLDGDDWLSLDACKTVHDEMVLTNCDVLVFSFYRVFKNHTITVACSDYENKLITIDNTNIEEYLKYALYIQQYVSRDLVNDASTSTSLWNKAYRRSFLIKNNITCPENLSLFEDNIFLIKLYSANPTIKFVDKILYNYRINAGSITQKTLGTEKEQINLVNAIVSIREQNVLFSEKLQWLLTIFTLMRVTQIIKSQCVYTSETLRKKYQWIKKFLSLPAISEIFTNFHNSYAFKMATKKHKLIGILYEYHLIFAVLFLFNMKRINDKTLEFDNRFD